MSLRKPFKMIINVLVVCFCVGAQQRCVQRIARAVMTFKTAAWPKCIESSSITCKSHLFMSNTNVSKTVVDDHHFLVSVAAAAIFHALAARRRRHRLHEIHVLIKWWAG